MHDTSFTVKKIAKRSLVFPKCLHFLLPLWCQVVVIRSILAPDSGQVTRFHMPNLIINLKRASLWNSLRTLSRELLL